MLSHRIIKRLCCLVIICLFSYFAIPCSAGQDKQKAMDRLAQEMAKLPESEKSKRIDRNIRKLHKALGNLAQPNADQDMKQYFVQAMNVFANSIAKEDEKIPALLNQWNDHLMYISHFSNNDYINAIGSQQSDYYKAINDLNDLITKLDHNQKNHSSKWIDDLSNKFGKDFIRANRNVILDNFRAVICRDYRSYEEGIKNLTYIEAMLYGSYKEYFGKFLDFYNQELSSDDKEKLSSRKDVAEAFLEIIGDVSFTQMYETDVLKEKMADISAQKQNKELFLFFKGLSGSHNFDISKADKDLKEALNAAK